MNVVTDTNVVIAVALQEPSKQALLDATVGCHLIAPDVLPYEICNAIRNVTRRTDTAISEVEAHKALQIALSIPVGLYPVDLGDALQLAIDAQILAWDAFFLELARVQQSPILTLDRRLIAAAQAIGVKAIEVNQ